MKGAKGIKTTLLRFASKPTLSVATFHSSFYFETRKLTAVWIASRREKPTQDVANCSLSPTVPHSLTAGTLSDGRVPKQTYCLHGFIHFK